MCLAQLSGIVISKIENTLRAVLLLSTLSLLFVGCGSGDNAATAVVAGRSIELDIVGVDCVAYPPSGAVPGYDGIMSAPEDCTISFRTGGYYLDYVTFTLADVRAINNQLGGWEIINGGGNVDAALRFQGVDQAIYSGQILFTDISNVPGNRTCGHYQIVTADAQFEGHFCGKVSYGY